MAKISVIVPIYNAEEYLGKCIESILLQSFVDFELILLDDGSTDKSADIAEKYAKVDDRIRVIRHPNNGVSFTRNQGINLSKGKYISFVDADDWIHQEMLNNMYITAEKHQAQVVQCGYYKVSAKTNKMSDPFLPEFSENTIYSPNELLKTQPNVHNHLYCYSVRFIYRKEMLVDNSIYFNEQISYGEDTLFNLQAILSAQSICFIQKAYYYYFRHEKSTMRKHYKPNLERSYNILYELKKQLFHKYGWDTNQEFMRDWSRFNVTTLLNRLLDNVFNGPEEEIDSSVKRILDSPLVKDSFKVVPLNEFFSADKHGVYTFALACCAKMRITSLVYYIKRLKSQSLAL